MKILLHALNTLVISFGKGFRFENQHGDNKSIPKALNLYSVIIHSHTHSTSTDTKARFIFENFLEVISIFKRFCF